MALIVLPQPRILADLIGKIALADWVAPKMHLFTNDISPSLFTALADLTEATFTGYAAAAVTYGTPYVDVNGIPVVSGGELVFTQTADPGENAYGCYLTNTAGSKLLWAGRFDDAPFVFSTDTVLTLTFKMSIDNGLITLPDLP